MNIDDLKKLLAAATPGPWSEQGGSIGRFVEGRYEWSNIADVATAPDRDAAEGEGRANALLICAAVNALPELLAENARLREALNEKRSTEWDEEKVGILPEDDSATFFIKMAQYAEKRMADGEQWMTISMEQYAELLKAAAINAERRAALKETGSFTDDPFNRAVLGLPLKEPGQ